MGTQTKIRQEQFIQPSKTYTENLAAGVALQTSSIDLETDLNAVRSQLHRIIDKDLGEHWYNDIPTFSGQKRALKQLNTDLYDLEWHKFLFRAFLLTPVTVPNGQNYVVLNAASLETPTEAAAVNGGTANGCVVATLAGDVGAHSLNEVSGWNNVSPKNLVIIHDTTTGDVILDGGKQVYGLLQAESGVADGDNFNDTTKQVQISFVKENAGGTDLVAANAAAVQNKVIHYAYVLRNNLDALPEQAFLTGIFADQSASVDVTLDNAIDNQSGPVTQQQNIDWRIDDTKTLKFETSDGGVNLLAIMPNVAGDEIEINVDTLDVNTVGMADFSNGVTVDSSGTPINLGVNAGQIDAAANLTLASTGAGNDLNLSAADLLTFSDGYRAGSTFGTLLQLSNSSAEWSAYETMFGGEVSLLNAITQAATHAGHSKRQAVVTANINANANATGAAGTPNLDTQLFDYHLLNFVTDVNVYVNGVLMRNGASAAADEDVYPGDSQVTGDLKFEFKLKSAPGNPDVITMEVFGLE